MIHNLAIKALADSVLAQDEALVALSTSPEDLKELLGPNILVIKALMREIERKQCIINNLVPHIDPLT